jgi:hypothetical protein
MKFSGAGGKSWTGLGGGGVWLPGAALRKFADMVLLTSMGSLGSRFWGELISATMDGPL